MTATLAFRLLLIPFVLLAAPAALAVTNTHGIEGYSNILSVSPGGTIKFSVHVPAGRSTYLVDIFRFGAEQKGARAIGQRVAGPFRCTNGRRRDYDADSYVDGASWPVSFSLKIPSASTTGTAPCTGAALPASDWVSGIYTAKLTDPGSGEYFHISFVVKDGALTRKSIALIASTNTWTAYNFWPGQDLGGASIYAGCGAPARDLVSFLRPNPYATPETHDIPIGTEGDCPGQPYYRTEHLAAGELRIAYWLEANDRPYSMLTDWDLETIPGVLNPRVFKTVIISTHSEYWSPGMYDAVRKYLDSGGNVVSLSGNTVYWRVDLTDTGGNRTLQKLENWTPQEQTNLLGIGSFGASGVGNADCTPYHVQQPAHRLFAGLAGLNSIGAAGVVGSPANPRSFCLDGSHGAAGWEVDRTDPSLKKFAREFALLGESSNAAQHANLVYLRRASAGQVLSAGSILFGQSLMADGWTKKRPLSTLLLNALSAFNRRSFGDFDSDGHADLLARKPDGSLWRYGGNGAGGFKAGGVSFDSRWNVFDRIVAPGDVDGDGRPDLLARNPAGDLWLYRGKGDGTLIQGGSKIGNGWDEYSDILAPGDFDDDGHNDLIGRRPDGTLWLYRGDGAGAFADPSAKFDSGWQVCPTILTPGDFDEDGNPDLICRKADGTLWLYRGDGQGGLVQGGTQFETGWNAFVEIITPGDFSGDDHADLLGRKPDGSLWLYPGSGNGTLVQGAAIEIGSGWEGFDLVLGVW